MNNGIRYGHRFYDPPSLQKDIFTLNSKMSKILTQYKTDPDYIKYRPILDRLEVLKAHLNNLITYMIELDQQEKKLYEIEKLANQTYKIEDAKDVKDKIEIVLQDFDRTN